MTQYSDMPEGATVVSTPQAQTPPTQPQAAQPQPQYSDMPQGATLAAPPAQKAPPANTDVSPKAGLDIGTAGSALAGVGEGLYGLVKGAVEPAAYLIAGTPHEDVQKQLTDAAEANKHAVYHKFADDFRKGSYSNAFKGLADLFKDEGADPNDPVHQFLEQQWQLSQQAKANAVEAGKKGDIAGVLQHSVGVVPIANAVDAAMTEFQKNPTRANLKEVIASAVPAFVPLMNKGIGKMSDAAKAAVKKQAAMGTETSPMGAQIPVRGETPLAKAVAAGSPEETAKFAQTQTAPAVQGAVGGTVGEAIGSEAATTLTPEDRMGIKGHANDLIENQARPAYQAMDKLSEAEAAKAPTPSWDDYVKYNPGKTMGQLSAGYDALKKSNMTFSEIQEKIDNARGDFSKEGRVEFKEAQAQKTAMMDKYREQLKSDGHDIDAADAAYRKGKATQKMAAKLDTATGPSNVEGAPYELDGKRLMKVVDDGVKNGSWKNMGLTEEHINELQSLAKTAAKQTEIPKVNALLSGATKLALLATGLHGGIMSLAEVATGVSAADYVGGKLSKHIMQDAMLNYDATRAMNESLKTGDAKPVVDALSKDPSWVARTKAFVQDLIDKRPFKGGGETGAVSLSPKGVTQRSTGPDVHGFKEGVSSKEYTDAIKANPQSDLYRLDEGNLPKHSQEEMDQNRRFSDGKGTYYSISPDGEIQRPLSNSSNPTAILKAAKSAIDNGGKTIDTWEGPVAKIYEKLGFKRTESVPYDAETYGEPSDSLKALWKKQGWKEGQPYPAVQKMEADEDALVARKHNDKGGSSFIAGRGDLIGREGFSVGINKNLEHIADGEKITAADVAAYRARPEVQDALKSNPDAFVGTWTDKGKTYFDTSVHVTDASEAMQLAKTHNQEAVYDLKKGETLPTTKTLHHWSNVEGLTETDPEKMGTGKAGREMSRAKEPGFLKRTNFGDQSYREASIQGQAHHYTAEVNPNKYYDVDKDPEGIWQEALRKDGPTAAEKAIHDAGYAGYRSGSEFASFEKVPVKSASKATPTQVNASGESAASLEAQGRLKSQQAQGLRTYDVDSRKAGSKDAWHPVMETVDAVDQKASPFHHLVQVSPEGKATILDSGEGAKPLPSNDRIQELVGQAAGEAPITPARPVDMSGSEIATRYPSSATAVTSNDPSQLSGIDALNEADRQSPTRMTQAGKPVLGVKQKLAAALADYKDNGVSNLLDASDPAAAIEKYVNHVKNNLKWLHDSMPESIRNAARGWYETAHNITKDIAQKNGVTHEQVAGVTAALSPKNDWNNNVGQAKRLIEHYANDQNHAWTDKMDQAVSDIRNNGAINDQFKRMLTDIRGKKLNELTAKSPEALLAKQALWYRILDEAHGSKDTPIYSPDGTVNGSQTLNWGQGDPIAKALSILDDGSVENIHGVMGEGHKIRNFYNNIINPFSERGHTTIDTHAVGAGLLKPLSQEDVEVAHNFGSGNKAGTPSPAKHAATGVKGSYSVHEEAYRRAAKELGLQPRELQSITWEGIRSLMGDDKKTPELRRAVNEIWRAHENGHFTLNEAREKILEHSGGFSKPNWMSDEQWEANPTEQGDTSFGGK